MAVSPAIAQPTAAAAAVVGNPTSGPFVSVPSARLVAVTVGVRKTVAVTVAGRAGLPASGVSVVALTVSVSGQKRAGAITAYPDGSARPARSDVDFVSGRAASGLVIARLGADGKLDIYNSSAASVRVVGYVSGYFVGGESRSDGVFTSLIPARLAEGRTSAVRADKTEALKVEGRAGVPASGVAAVALTVTVSGQKRAGAITVYRDGSSRPTLANLNFEAGQPVSAVVVVRVGGDGKVDLYSGSAGTVDPAVYVSGYFTGGGSKFSGAFTALGPNRLLGTGTAAVRGGARKTVTLAVAGRGGVPASGAAAIALTVTVSAPKRACAITAYADGSARPGSADLEFAAGQTVSGLVIARLGADGKVDLFNGSAGTVKLTGFVSGYFNDVLSGVAKVVTNSNSSCALLASGGVDCWGGGPIPALGNGANLSSNVPVAVEGVGGTGTLGGVASLSAQGETIWALLSSGGVDCWGAGSTGVLGAGDSVLASTTPMAVLGLGGTGTLSGVTDLSGDGSTMCALLAGGSVDCWGADNAGQLGTTTIPPTGDSFVPVEVAGAHGVGTLTGVDKLATDFSSFCAVAGGGRVDCWGSNVGGQLGNGNDTGPQTCEGQVCGMSPAPAVSVSGRGSLAGVASLVSNSLDEVGGLGYYAILDTGAVEAWGAGTNAQGVLGNDPFMDAVKYSVPAPV